MPVVLYEMKGCHFCQKAVELFAKQIGDGRMKVLPASECPKEHKPRGFPFFVSEETEKTHTGLPSSWDELVSKIGGDDQGSEKGAAQVVTWVMAKCPWCTKFKQEMQGLIDEGVVMVVQHDDPNTPPPPEVNGFPFSMNIHTGSKASGYMPLQKAVSELDISVEGFSDDATQPHPQIVHSPPPQQQRQGQGGTSTFPAGHGERIPSWTPPPHVQPGVHFKQIPGVDHPLPYVYWPKYGAYPYLSHAWDNFAAFGVL